MNKFIYSILLKGWNLLIINEIKCLLILYPNKFGYQGTVVDGEGLGEVTAPSSSFTLISHTSY